MIFGHKIQYGTCAFPSSQRDAYLLSRARVRADREQFSCPDSRARARAAARGGAAVRLHLHAGRSEEAKGAAPVSSKRRLVARDRSHLPLRNVAVQRAAAENRRAARSISTYSARVLDQR